MELKLRSWVWANRRRGISEVCLRVSMAVEFVGLQRHLLDLGTVSLACSSGVHAGNTCWCLSLKYCDELENGRLEKNSFVFLWR